MIDVCVSAKDNRSIECGVRDDSVEGPIQASCATAPLAAVTVRQESTKQYSASPPAAQAQASSVLLGTCGAVNREDEAELEGFSELVVEVVTDVVVPLSLCLSLTHSLIVPLTHSLSLCLSISLTVPLTLSHCASHSLSLCLSPTLLL
jgi:hypothetical protein